jgi:hypothetical protein
MPTTFIFKNRFTSFLQIILVGIFSLNFSLITNNEINATFLSRYIAKKLDYHHKLRQVLNPLKREFKVVGRVTRLSFSTTNRLNSSLIIKLKEYWRLILLFLFRCFDIQLRLIIKQRHYDFLLICLEFFIGFIISKMLIH